MSKIVKFRELINYIKYIKDISRELSVSSNIDKILIKSKNKSKKYRYLEPKRISTKQIDKINGCIKLESLDEYLVEIVRGYSLFLGIGCLYGNPKHSNTKDNLIGGPLLLAQLELDNSELDEIELDELELNKLDFYEFKEHNLNLNGNIFVNYNLIARLIGYSHDSEEEEEEEDIQNLLRYKNISELVKKLEKFTDNFNDYDFSYLAKNCFQIINSHLNLQFNFQIEEKIINELLENKQVEQLNDKLLLDVNALYLLAIKAPHEISIYHSIKLLEEELEEQKKLQNELIDILLRGIFYKESDPINPNEEEWSKLKDYIEKYLPLTLSNTQKEAILKAFTSKISYIQGPPGTGKSYTITAMAMLALLTGKKVLIVSSKEPAVKVVAEKLEPHLKNEMNVLPFIFITDQTKNRLKEEINILLNISRFDRLAKLEETKNTFNNIKSQIKNYHDFIKDNARKIDDIIKKNTEYIKINKDLNNLRKYFEENYYSIENEEKIQKENLKILKLLKLFLDKLSNSYKNEMPLSYAIYFYSAISLLYNFGKPIFPENFKNFCRYYVSTPEFINLALEIYEKYVNIVEIYYEINQFDINQRKKNLNLYRNILQDRTKEYIKTHNVIRILEKLNVENIKNELKKFRKLLYYKKKDLIANLRKNIDFEKLLEVYPVWICEIKKINELLPMFPEIFDLVIIDESSQVNLPEILPIIYRGKSLCIVGDHKQLSLISTGLPLKLSKKFDELTWNKYKPGNIDYKEASKRKLIVTESSILDLITCEENYISVPQTMLNEHFRSLPILADFTSKQFYDNKLIIMTKTPDKINLLPNNLYPVRVKGERYEKGKGVPEEANIVVEIVESLMKNKSFAYINLYHVLKGNFSIGIISPIRDQVEMIRYLIENRGLDHVFCGTPEEAQGHEFDVSIITLSANEKASKVHYENPNRFNVMTSRAKYFTFFVYSKVPVNFTLTRKYLNHFGYNLDNISEGQEIYTDYFNITNSWKFDENKFESDFERIIYHQLKAYVDRKKNGNIIKIYNQVDSCGRRLDFVLYNETNHTFVAVEVDGIYHFKEDNPKQYNEEHIERIEQLERAGWKIINTQYYKWFNKYGRLLPEDLVRNEIERIYKLLDEYLQT